MDVNQGPSDNQPNQQPEIASHQRWSDSERVRLHSLGIYYATMKCFANDLWQNGSTERSIPDRPSVSIEEFMPVSTRLRSHSASVEGNELPGKKARSSKQSDASLRQLSEYLKKMICKEPEVGWNLKAELTGIDEMIAHVKKGKHY